MELFLLPFFLDSGKYALDVSTVDSVVRAVEITHLPKAPEIVLGIINVRGEIIPVLDIRRRFGVESKRYDINDALIIANTSKRKVALLVDGVEPVFRLNRTVTPAVQVVPGLHYVEGIIKLPEGFLFIHDLDTFLSLDEEQDLSRSMEKYQHQDMGKSDIE